MCRKSARFALFGEEQPGCLPIEGDGKIVRHVVPGTPARDAITIGDTFIRTEAPAYAWEVTRERNGLCTLEGGIGGRMFRLVTAAQLTETGPGAHWARCEAQATVETLRGG